MKKGSASFAGPARHRPSHQDHRLSDRMIASPANRIVGAMIGRRTLAI